jgi:transcriptional regulator with XRE-family HTH domain
MDLKEVVAVNLRRARHAKKMTQEELAEAADLSARYIGAIERADKSPSVSVLGRIADALMIDPAELIQPVKPRPGGKTKTHAG